MLQPEGQMVNQLIDNLMNACMLNCISRGQATRVQSTDQTTALVYADVGSTLSRRNPNTANTNISLQLDDNHVQYADLKHHQTPELRQKECNSHTGSYGAMPLTSSLHVVPL